MGVYWIRFKLD